MASALADAQAIREAIKGLGTDDAKLVDIITHRSNEQLQQVTAEYQSGLGRNIFDDIKGDTSGDYRELLISLVEPKAQFVARTVHKAVKGAGTDEAALIDALAHTPNAIIKAAGDSYHKLYHKTIIEDVSGDTSGDFKRVLVGILAGNRDQTSPPNRAQAEADAEHLYKKGEGKIGTDETAFVEFFLQRSPAHIQEVNSIYTQKRGHGLVYAINSEFSGSIRKVLKALATPRHEYWAGRIHSALQGLGTNDAALIRAFVLNDREQLKAVHAAYGTHSERKKGSVKNEKKKDKKKETKKKSLSGSLEADIKGDTSGWYEKSLLSLLH